MSKVDYNKFLGCPGETECSCNMPSGSLGRSFFGRIWDSIKANAGTIIGGVVGGLVGGPIGMAIGAGVANWLNEQIAGDQSDGLNAVVLEYDPVAGGTDEYPLSNTEEMELVRWFETIFTPSIVAIANTMDIVLMASDTQRASNTDPKIIVVNEALRKLSILRAYVSSMRTYGDQYMVFGNLKTRSANYAENKAVFMERFLDLVEKAIFAYVQSDLPGFKLVVSDEEISRTTKVERIDIIWPTQSVVGKIKKYVADNKEVTETETEIEVVNTDVTSAEPPLDPTTTETVNQTTQTGEAPAPQSNKSKITKWLLYAAAGFGTYKLIRKK